MSTTLPLGIEPLRLADGTLIDPTDGMVIDDDNIAVEVPNTQELQQLVVQARKRISDLPVPIGKMNVVSLVLCYSLFGIRDDEIAITLGLTLDNIAAIKESQVYEEVRTEITRNVIEASADTVRGMFLQSSVKAARKIEGLIDSKDKNVALSASKDVLDRAGHRPVDVHEHRHTVEGGLRIEYVDRKSDALPTLNINADGEF